MSKRVVRGALFLALVSLVIDADVALAQRRGGSRAATDAQPATPAAPSPSDEARVLFGRGQTAYQQGDYQNAVALWEQAYALDARPQLQYNLAQAYGRLGRFEDERDALRRFLDSTDADDPSHGSTRARLAMLEQRLARTGIVVRGDYDGATVLIDGEDRGRLPHPEPFTLSAGSHEIEVRLAGHEPFHGTAVVPAGAAVALDVTLRPTAPAAVAEAPPDPNRSRLPLALYVTGGTLVVVGAVFGGLTLAASSDHPVVGTADADRSKTFAIVTDVAIGAGVATAAAGLIVHLVTRDHGDRAARVDVQPVATRSLVGLSASGHF